MSRIEELSTLVKNQTTLVDNLESLIEKERLLKTRYANELFEATKALEAQEKKPKEYVIAVTDTGQIYGQWTDIPYGSKFERITVIEKLPVKVTREMVAKMQKIYWGVVTPPDNMAQLVEVLKAAGIDAEPSND